MKNIARTCVWFWVLLAGFCFSAEIGTWNHWEWLNPRPQGRRLSGVAASDSLVVAVGRDGTILASENGLDWDHVLNEGGDLYLEDVTWTGGRFLAVGGRTIASSTDGFLWTMEPQDFRFRLEKVASNGSITLMIGLEYDASHIFRSEDHGLSWEQTADEAQFFDLDWTGELFVMVDGKNIWSSHGGEYWRTEPLGQGGFVRSRWRSPRPRGANHPLGLSNRQVLARTRSNSSRALSV